jgi:hypothetical protein
VPVDGRLGHAGPGSYGLDGEGAVTSLAELAERCEQDYLPRTLDTWVNAPIRTHAVRLHLCNVDVSL